MFRPILAATRQPLGEIHSRANEQLYREPERVQALTKRKRTDEVDLSGASMETCNVVRGKIRRFLESGEMKKGEFAEAIGVSPSALNNFLAHTGSMDGAGCDAYGNAWEFFKQRDLAKKAMPKAKKQKPAATPQSIVSAFPAAPSAYVFDSLPDNGTSVDIRGIALAGEASDGVRVYDSCDEVRKKINAHLAQPGITQAQLCRDMESQVHTVAKKIRSKQLTDFRNKSGPTTGNTSIVYYTAYVFFEKQRLAQGRPKSKQRLGMEAQWPQGANTERVRHRSSCAPGTVPRVDSFGAAKVIRRH